MIRCIVFLWKKLRYLCLFMFCLFTPFYIAFEFLTWGDWFCIPLSIALLLWWVGGCIGSIVKFACDVGIEKYFE